MTVRQIARESLRKAVVEATQPDYLVRFVLATALYFVLFYAASSFVGLNGIPYWLFIPLVIVVQGVLNVVVHRWLRRHVPELPPIRGPK